MVLQCVHFFLWQNFFLTEFCHKFLFLGETVFLCDQLGELVLFFHFFVINARLYMNQMFYQPNNELIYYFKPNHLSL